MPSRSQTKNALISTRPDEQRSQRSASCDERHSAAPFSVNESDLHLENHGIDSAHASFADWVELIEAGRAGHHGFGEISFSKLNVGEVLFDINDGKDGQLMEMPQNLLDQSFQLPDIAEVSAIDELNEAFINEHSMMQPGGAAFRGEVSEVRSRLDGLQVQNFSIMEEM